MLAPNSYRHRSLVASLAQLLKEHEGLELKAIALEGYRRPWPIAGYAPDIIAYSEEEELLCLGDVVLFEDLFHPTTAAKLRAHSRLLMWSGKSRGRPVPLHIGASHSYTFALKSLIADLGLQGDIRLWDCSRIMVAT
jgi:hypothetical protein